MQPRLSLIRIKKTMGNSLGSTELAHLEPTLPGVKNFHVPKTIAHRILGHRRFLNNFGRNSGEICGPFPGIFVARPKSGSRELAPLAFARASSTQAMIGCSKQWFTLFLEKEKKRRKTGQMRGENCTPPPPRGVTLVAGACGSSTDLSSSFIFELYLWAPSLEQETLFYNAI